MTKFMIGTIQTGVETEEFSGKQHNFKLVSDLTSAEYETLMEALNTVSGFLQDSQLFMIAAWNFREFTELIASYLQAYSKKDFNAFVQKPINININRAFLNFLSSIRSYLDFMERLLKKRYGEESVLFSNFKKSCSTEYDGNFSYRFLYNLRHYAQHKGLPIGAINWGQQISSNDPPKVVFYLGVSVVRDEILKDFDWRAMKNEVKDLPERIEILPQILSFMESLSRIHAKVINDIFHTLNDSARQIMVFGEKLAGQEGEPVIFEFEGDIRNVQQLSHRSLPIKLAQQIVDGELVEVLQQF
jgi:hypothetical protein